MRILFALIIAFVTVSADAVDLRTQKAERIARILGIEQILVEAQKSTEETARADLENVVQEMRRIGLKDEAVRMIEKLFEPLVQKVNAAWDIKEAGRIYSMGLVDTLSDQELDEAEKYYSTDEGKKAYAAISSSEDKMLAYIDERSNAVLKMELAKIFDQIRQYALKRKSSKP